MKTTVNLDLGNGMIEIPVLSLAQVVKDLKTKAFNEGVEEGKKATREEFEKVPQFMKTTTKVGEVSKTVEESVDLHNIRAKEKLEGFREGYDEGYKDAQANKGNATKFNKKIHVDRGLYGYVKKVNFDHFNSKGAAMRIDREPNVAEGRDYFVKITPADGGEV